MATHIEIRVNELPSNVFPIIFEPLDLRNLLPFNGKIATTYALINRAKSEKRHLQLIVGSPATKIGTEPDPDMVRIDDIVIHQAQRFSLLRTNGNHDSLPRMYAELQEKKYIISTVIEWALSQNHHVYIVESKLVKKFQPKRTNEHFIPIRQAKPIPLVTPNGLDLRTLSPEEFQKKIAHRTETQRRRLTRAYGGETATQIAGQEEQVSAQSVRSSIDWVLAHIDIPIHRTSNQLVTPSGLDLRTLSVDQFQKKIAHRTETQRRRLTMAYEGHSVSEIAHAENVVPQTIRSSINWALAHIDIPIHRTSNQLVTPSGLDLRTLSVDQFQKKIAHRTETQRRRLTMAYEGHSVSEIAHAENVTLQSVTPSIYRALARIDTPYYKSLSIPTSKYQYGGKLFTAMTMDERLDAYRHLHLSEPRINILELYLGIRTSERKSFEQIAEAVSLSKKQVGYRLATIRRLCQHSNGV